jgi:hypothetical protein
VTEGGQMVLVGADPDRFFTAAKSSPPSKAGRPSTRALAKPLRDHTPYPLLSSEPVLRFEWRRCSGSGLALQPCSRGTKQDLDCCLRGILP